MTKLSVCDKFSPNACLENAWKQHATSSYISNKQIADVYELFKQMKLNFYMAFCTTSS